MTNNISSIWFYTFSTSAQVLAALVGLFAVFVVYKIQSLSTIYDDVKGGVVNIIANYLPRTDYNIDVQGKLEEIVFWDDKKLQNTFDKLLKKHATLSPEKQIRHSPGISPLFAFAYTLDSMTLTVFGGLIYRNYWIFRKLACVIVLSFVSIIFNIFCLAFPNILAPAYVAIIINLGLVAFNLFLIGVFAFKISKA